jgi:hypothetical protein
MVAMTDDTIRESMVKRFHTIPGLGLSKAELLFDAGYTTISSLQKADVEGLSQINGISAPLARYILREVRKMSDEVPSETVSCSTDLQPTSKPEDADNVSIKVSEEPAGAMSIGKPEDDIKAEGTESAPAKPDAPAQPSGPGFFSGLVGSLKSLFGGGKKATPEVTETKPAEPAEAVTVREDTGETKPAGEDKPLEKPTEEKKPEAIATKELSEVSITVDHKDEPKAETKPVPDDKKGDPTDAKPAPKKGGGNERIVEDIIKELELDKEHR